MSYIQKVTIKLEKCGRLNLREDIPDTISNDKKAAEVVKEYLKDADREYLGVICLNTKNKILNISTVHIGALNKSIAHPREVFKTAILSNAASIIIFHNHPSGDTTPSNEDKDITQRIKECSNILGISLLDHIIVGYDTESYFSMKKECYI